MVIAIETTYDCTRRRTVDVTISSAIDERAGRPADVIESPLSQDRLERISRNMWIGFAILSILLVGYLISLLVRRRPAVDVGGWMGHLRRGVHRVGHVHRARNEPVSRA